MVTAIGRVLPGSSVQTAEPASEKTQRSIAEARRLVTQNHVTGAKAMRIINMLSQAQQSVTAGKSVDAERLAREALKIAQEEENPTEIPSRSASNEEQENAAAPMQPNGENSDETPASNAMGVDPDQPFERETTSYADGSDDSGVSFQSAQPLTPAQAPFAVRLHELSHIRRETSDAILNGQRVLTSVAIHSRIDPMTGERHVGGGRTRVIVFPDIQPVWSRGNNLDVKG